MRDTIIILSKIKFVINHGKRRARRREGAGDKAPASYNELQEENGKEREIRDVCLCSYLHFDLIVDSFFYQRIIDLLYY